MYPIINTMIIPIKKNTEMIIEIIITIKKKKDILLIIIKMSLNMKEEAEVGIVQKDIKVAVRENIVAIALVEVGVEEVEIIMSQDRIIIIIIIIIIMYIIKIIAEIKNQIIIINQRKEIIKKKEDV
jgi:hypothetical protein